MSVGPQVVAAQDRERARGPIAPERERGGDPVERRGTLRVARLGDRQRQDRRPASGDQLRGGAVVTARGVNEAGDGADDLSCRFTGALLDQRLQVVLIAQIPGHVRILCQQPQADDSPVVTGGRKLVDVDGEVRAVKSADSHVDDARLESSSVVRGDRNPPERDLGQAGLTEANGW